MPQTKGAISPFKKNGIAVRVWASSFDIMSKSISVERAMTSSDVGKATIVFKEALENTHFCAVLCPSPSFPTPFPTYIRSLGPLYKR